MSKQTTANSSTISPEEALLVAVVGFAANQTSIEPMPSLDWDRVFTLARAHQIVPLLQDALKPLPDAIADKVRQRTRERKVRTMVMTQDLHKLLHALTQDDIPTIVLKGAVHAHTIYPKQSWRFFDDIDLLVPADRGADALAAIQRIGYAPHPNADRPDWHHLIAHVHPKHGTTVEIHTDVMRRADAGQANARWTVGDLWQRSTSADVEGVTVQTLSHADALVHTAVHARHHLFEKLAAIMDAAFLAKAIEDWDRVNSLAAAAGGRVALAHTLRLATRFGLLDELPPVMNASRSRLALAQRVAGWDDLTPLPASLRSGTLPRLIELALFDDAGSSLRMTRELLAPRGEFVSESYGSTWQRLWSRGKLVVKQMANINGGG